MKAFTAFNDQLPLRFPLLPDDPHLPRQSGPLLQPQFRFRPRFRSQLHRFKSLRHRLRSPSLRRNPRALSHSFLIPEAEDVEEDRCDITVTYIAVEDGEEDVGVDEDGEEEEEACSSKSSAHIDARLQCARAVLGDRIEST